MCRVFGFYVHAIDHTMEEEQFRSKCHPHTRDSLTYRIWISLAGSNDQNREPRIESRSGRTGVLALARDKVYGLLLEVWVIAHRYQDF